MLDLVKSSNSFQVKWSPSYQIIPTLENMNHYRDTGSLSFFSFIIVNNYFCFFLCNAIFISAPNSMLKSITSTIYPSFSCPFIHLIYSTNVHRVLTKCQIECLQLGRQKYPRQCPWLHGDCFGKKTVSNSPYLLQTSLLVQYCLHIVQTQVLD